MSLRVALLLTGSELLDGRVLDTNSQWCIGRLTDEGHTVVHTLTCGDGVDPILRSLEFLESSCDAVIVSGGLGPTSDDVTRDAIAAWAGVPLVENDRAKEHVTSFFARRQRPMSPTNSRQWFFPQGSSVIENPVGTAYGFSITQGSNLVFSIPGVPSELKAMFPAIQEILSARPQSAARPVRRILSTCLIPESELAGKVEALGLPAEVDVVYRAAFPEVHVGVVVAPSIPEAEGLAEESFKKIQGAIGADSVLATANRELPPLEEIVVRILVERGESVSVAESCTGGVIGALLTSIPGSSSVFKGGVISYANSVKESVLRVPADTLSNCGAVSKETAIAMAKGTRELCGTTYGISVTGIAGPDGGSEAKPVGTFYVGVAGPSGVEAFATFYPGNRDRIRKYAAHRSLDLLRRTALSLPLR